jgi:hypothetical protein
MVRLACGRKVLERDGSVLVISLARRDEYNESGMHLYWRLAVAMPNVSGSGLQLDKTVMHMCWFSRLNVHVLYNLSYQALD